MKVLIAPLNWGLGHATRCLPLIVRHLRAGDEVVLAGDGDSLLLLRRRFPGLRFYRLASLHLTYSHHNSQVGAILRALPRLLRSARQDQRLLLSILEQEHFDLIISDNRFGFFIPSARKPSFPDTRCVYLTHQLLIRMPLGLRWLEPFGQWLHRRIIRHYDECWVPDFEGTANLSGDLSHLSPLSVSAPTHFIGPLSRFEFVQPEPMPDAYDVVAVLSGLEPQRTIFERQLKQEFAHSTCSFLLVRGKMAEPMMRVVNQHMTILPRIDDGQLAWYLLHASTIIMRSGYSSIMDLAALGLLEKEKRGEVCLRLVPTPGQTEQEYLATLHR